MAEEQVDIDSIIIAPMEKQMAKGAFSDVEDFTSLASWYRTCAFIDQREGKSKTYVALAHDEVVGYVTVSVVTVENMPDEKNTNSFQYQAMSIGKLLVSPTKRSAGVGTILLKFAIDIAMQLDMLVGCRGIFVDANNNERTINFYESRGFMRLSVSDDESASDRTVRMLMKLGA